MSKKKRLKALFSHWVTEPTPQNIACHLHDKTEMFSRIPSGFYGEPGPMEKQIIQHMRILHQQVLVLTNVIQALLIIEDERISQRMKRAFRWLLEGVKKLWHGVKESRVYKIYAVVIGASLWPIIRGVVWLFDLFRGYIVHRR